MYTIRHHPTRATYPSQTDTHLLTRWSAATLLLCLFVFASPLPLAAAEPELPGVGIGPELDDTPEENKSGSTGVNSGDYAYIQRLLANQVTAGSSDPTDIARLRRIRNALRATLAGSKPQTDEERELLKRLKTFLQKEVVHQRSNRSSRETLAMFYLFVDEPEKALELFQKLGPASPDDMAHPLQLAYTYLRLGDFAKAQTALDASRRLLGGRTPLQLFDPVFCETITAYRLYTPRENTPMQAGDDCLIYMEVTGAAFQRDPVGNASCNLRFGLSIKNDLQEVIWSDPEYGSWTQAYRGTLRDLHVSIAFRIPNNLPGGKYHLFIACQDILSGHQKTACTGFSLGTQVVKTKPTTTAAPNALDESTDATAALLKKQLDQIKKRQRESDDIYDRNSDLLHWQRSLPSAKTE